MKSNKAIIWVGVAALAATFSAAALMLPPAGATKPAPGAVRQSANQATIPTLADAASRRSGGKDVLVVDAELGRLFEFHLSASAEKSLESIRLEIERELERRFAPKPAGEAKRLLARYVDYKLELLEIEKNARFSGGTARVAHARLQAVRQVRARYFSEQEIEGLFGENQSANPNNAARHGGAMATPTSGAKHGIRGYLAAGLDFFSNIHRFGRSGAADPATDTLLEAHLSADRQFKPAAYE